MWLKRKKGERDDEEINVDFKPEIPYMQALGRRPSDHFLSFSLSHFFFLYPIFTYFWVPSVGRLNRHPVANGDGWKSYPVEPLLKII
jgi:hypothetical protein